MAQTLPASNFPFTTESCLYGPSCQQKICFSKMKQISHRYGAEFVKSLDSPV